MNYQEPLLDVGVALAELVAKGTASAVNKKIRVAKEIKDIERLRNTYDGLINELLNEREEAVSIAQAYKSEIDRIEISDEDIEHLHNTVSKVLEIFKQMTNDNESLESFNQLKDLITIDSLKTMQLLGFNYKAAIGEPLTEICAVKIKEFGGLKSKNVKANKR